MTPRERFVAALDRHPVEGRVPHFELIFHLTAEAFGKVHPDHRDFSRWPLMTDAERQRERNDMADLYLAIAERFGHSAIFLRPYPRKTEEAIRMVDLIRDKSGDRFCLLKGGDATFTIPTGEQLAAFCYQLADEPDQVKARAEAMLATALRRAEALQKHGGLDGFVLASDYCDNRGPFLSPALFAEFIAPYLARLTRAYRDMGFYVIKHTDGNIMPILDQLLQSNPHALHSLDPQAGVDIAEVKRRCGHQLCLIGGVNCALLDSGTEGELRESARYALQHGMAGGGYVFSSSNCIHAGAKLERYEAMLDVWRQHGNSP